MPIPLYQVDAFASEPFAGNPAAVCTLPAPRPASWMQVVATEMNLSETAFLIPTTDGSYRLRWFTPTVEVDLCGHATIASAHVLWSEGHLAHNAPARLDTRSGKLVARRNDGWIRTNFPADTIHPTDAPKELTQGLADSVPQEVARTDRDYLVRLENAQEVRALEPDLDAFERIEAGRGVIFTARGSTDDIDFVSRYFAPGYGIPEDPVTGSTHCALGPYWARELGRTSLTARQVSDRGGTIRVHLDSPEADRVVLGGQAVTVLRGRLASGETPTIPDAG